MSDGRKAPIIIKKKVSGHGGHHGGAWKVAYADFVTAMMALFIVLWLMNSNANVREAVAGYFRDPAGVGNESGTGTQGNNRMVSVPSITVAEGEMAKIKEKLETAIKKTPVLQSMKDQVEMTLSPDGLRIELLETETGMFFESGRPTPTASSRRVLERLAAELGKLKNRMVIEGHTDAKPFAGGRAYGNWELSAERANEARRIMQENGLRANQIIQVRGFADQDLRDPKNPESASNRRVSIIVHYTNSAPDAGEDPEEKPALVKPGPEKAAEKKPEPPKPAGHK